MTVNSKIHRFACCLAILLGPSLASAANYRVVYSFQGAGDGSGPQASLTNVGGVLYGATTGSGGSGCASFDYGCGTIFKIAKNGDEKVLHVIRKGNRTASSPVSALRGCRGTPLWRHRVRGRDRLRRVRLREPFTSSIPRRAPNGGGSPSPAAPTAKCPSPT